MCIRDSSYILPELLLSRTRQTFGREKSVAGVAPLVAVAAAQRELLRGLVEDVDRLLVVVGPERGGEQRTKRERGVRIQQRLRASRRTGVMQPVGEPGFDNPDILLRPELGAKTARGVRLLGCGGDQFLFARIKQYLACLLYTSRCV